MRNAHGFRDNVPIVDLDQKTVFLSGGFAKNRQVGFYGPGVLRDVRGDHHVVFANSIGRCWEIAHRRSTRERVDDFLSLDNPSWSSGSIFPYTPNGVETHA